LISFLTLPFSFHFSSFFSLSAIAAPPLFLDAHMLSGSQVEDPSHLDAKAE